MTDMMTVQMITDRLFAIGKMIVEKTGETPWIVPNLIISNGMC